MAWREDEEQNGQRRSPDQAPAGEGPRHVYLLLRELLGRMDSEEVRRNDLLRVLQEIVAHQSGTEKTAT